MSKNPRRRAAQARVGGFPHPSPHRGTGAGWIDDLLQTPPRQLTPQEWAWLELPPSIQGELRQERQKALYDRFLTAGWTFPASAQPMPDPKDAA